MITTSAIVQQHRLTLLSQCVCAPYENLLSYTNVIHNVRLCSNLDTQLHPVSIQIAKGFLFRIFLAPTHVPSVIVHK